MSIDRSIPRIVAHAIQPAVQGGSTGLFADVTCDDFCSARIDVIDGLESHTVQSDRESTRHGMTWRPKTSEPRSVSVRLVVTNKAGLTSEVNQTIPLPAFRADQLSIERSRTAIRHGYLLPFFVDLDADGLQEFVFNNYEDGWIGDTVRVAETNGNSFVLVGQLLANVFPRDIGDTDGDGRQELLGQVSAATLLLEQAEGAALPTEPAFVDTTGLTNPSSPEAVWGAALTDLDQDGKGEILSHNTSSFRILEFDGSQYRESVRLENTTEVSGELTTNSFQQPEALIGDFDGDSSTDIVVGDSDGDWMLYEFTGDDKATARWSFETAHYNAGARFASGDLNGDGRQEIILSATNWIGERSDGVYEPDVTQLYVITNVGNDEYVVQDSLAFPGEWSQHNGITTGDIDGDGRDEVVVVAVPHLYIMRYDGGWSVAYHWGPTPGAESASGARSAKIAVGDVNGNGNVDLLVAGADEYFHQLEFVGVTSSYSPRWIQAYPADMQSALLRWNAPGADSVDVYSAPLDGPFDIDTTVSTDSSTIRPLAGPLQFLLRAWSNGEQSAPSEIRTVYPAPPTSVTGTESVDRNSILLLVSAPIQSEPIDNDHIRLAVGDGTQDTLAAADILAVRGGRALSVRFSEPVRSGELIWKHLRDHSGAPIADGSLTLVVDEIDNSFFVESWQVLDTYSLSVTFSRPLNQTSATQQSAFSIHPFGSVASVEVASPRTIIVRLAGIVTGATGLNATMQMSGIESSSGQMLANEGSLVSLSEPATGLATAYVYPNPVSPGVNAVTIGGIPLGTQVDIISPTGSMLQSLVETSGSGGLRWDLTTGRGEIVTSGVY
ncbi:MAG: VCBS repeat-containing protein, partial [Rhodothermales bacterium]|nr:VCBS repeat-containing protein [Rhodothermales bacterium]